LLSGVVQGSEIGPVLVLIYIDNLAKPLERNGFTVKLFADDVKVYLEVVENADVTKLQGALDLVASWATQWKLQISVSKCSVLTVGLVRLTHHIVLTVFRCHVARNVAISV